MSSTITAPQTLPVGTWHGNATHTVALRVVDNYGRTSTITTSLSPTRLVTLWKDCSKLVSCWAKKGTWKQCAGRFGQ